MAIKYELLRSLFCSIFFLFLIIAVGRVGKLILSPAILTLPFVHGVRQHKKIIIRLSIYTKQKHDNGKK